jgi:hypothetical protein
MLRNEFIQRMHQGTLAVNAPLWQKGGATNTTSTVNQFSEAESAKRAQVADEATLIYNQSAPQMTAAGYPGAAPVPVDWNTYAGQDLTRAGAGEILQSLNSTQQAGDMAASAAQGTQSRLGNAYASLGQAQGALNQQNAINMGQNMMMAQGMQYGLNGAMDVQNNPYLYQAMQAAIRPVTQSYTDPNGVMSQIRTGAQQTGQYGGSRQGIAEGIAAGRYADTIGDITAKMGSAGYESGQQTFRNSLATVPAWQQAAAAQASANTNQAKAASELYKADAAGSSLFMDYMKNAGSNLNQITAAAQAPGAMYSSIGAQNENIAREWADYQANQRMWSLNAPWVPLQNYASIVYGGSAPSTQATTQTTGSRNALGQVVGAGLTAASLYNMMGA